MEATGAQSTVHTGDLETPVFSGARRRLPWLRAAAIAAGALVVLWLAALVAGVLGFEGVSGLSLPGVDGARTPVLHRAPDPESVSAAGALRPGTAGGSAARRLRAATVHSRLGSGGSASGAGTSAPRRATRPAAPSGTSHSGAARPTASLPATSGSGTSPTVTSSGPGRHLGSSGTGSTTTSSSSHRATAPGQLDAKPVPQSSHARSNRTTTIG